MKFSPFKAFVTFGKALLIVAIGAGLGAVTMNFSGKFLKPMNPRTNDFVQNKLTDNIFTIPSPFVNSQETAKAAIAFNSTTQPQVQTEQTITQQKVARPIQTNEPAIAAASNVTSVSSQATTQIASGLPDCTVAVQKEPIYSGRFLNIRKKAVVAPGEAFQVQVSIENTGNMPWFSAESGCTQTPVYLGTEVERDRKSPFAMYLDAWDSHWISDNRIKMDNMRVDPQNVATFTFWAKAPNEEGLYREFYAPVVEGISWMEDDALFSTDIRVGDTELDPDQRNYLAYIRMSGNLSKIDLSGDKSIEVDLSKQEMYVRKGDVIIREFPVSTGAPGHPTPPGEYHILLKQTVRVAGSEPHYIMPNFMMFKEGGYGIHALPSLANDHGVFWREALDHIGSPKSHGCVRLLPENSDFVFNYADVGTKMTIHT